MSSSSPARRPMPMVLSIGVKPSGTGWYSPTLPVVTLSLRSTSTSSAERGAMLPVSASRRQVCPLVTVRSTVSVTKDRPPGIDGAGCIVAPRSCVTAVRSGLLSPPEGTGLAGRGELRAIEFGDLVPEADDRPDPRLVVLEVHPLVRGMCPIVGRGEPDEDDRQPEVVVEAGADRDRAPFPDEHRRP